MASLLERDVVERVRRTLLDAEAPVVLAVSGGVDSMVLLDAAARAEGARIAAVATFDHGTGAHAARAVAHVEREANARGLRVACGRATGVPSPPRATEASWREARHRFLADVAARHDARIATGHTRDDQVETVLMRVLRGSGARGLAGLAVKGPLLRPLLEIPRAAVERYARARRLEWLDDPSNASRAFLRNRIRHDLLPALRAADASIDDALWSVGMRASRWRAEAEALLDERFTVRHPDRHTLVVAAQELAGYDRDSLCVLWGVLAGRVGLALDRRGTRRCATFTMERRRGTIPLSGGWRLETTRDAVVLRRAGAPTPDATTLPSEGTLAWGGFRFTVADDATTDSSWSAWLEESDALTVRRWRAGDRLGPSHGQGRRRVARYLADARVQGGERERWPVVVRGEEVVWIPGVRRSDAATARSGRPARHYLCERADR